MAKLNKKQEIEKLKQVLIEKIKLENDDKYINLHVDEIMRIIDNSGLGGKYSLWICREYLKNNIQRFEDMERAKQALILFKNNLNKFTEQQKQLNKMSFQELESLVETHQDVLTQNAIKRMNKEKIWAEIDVIYSGPEGKIYVPKTEQAAIFLGQGTKWCTASTFNNMFESYNKQGPLYVFILPEKDKQGREFKYQLHFESGQFMNAEDEDASHLYMVTDKYRNLFGKITTDLDEKNIMKKFLTSPILSVICDVKEKIPEYYDDILIEKIKLNGIAECIAEHSTFPEKVLSFIVENKIPLSPDFIPCDLKNDKLVFELCKNYVEYNNKNFSEVPKEYINYELCKIAISYSYNLKYIPDEFLTYELCLQAAQMHPSALRYIPDRFKTKEIFLTVLVKDPYLREYIPGDLRNYDFYKECIANGVSLGIVPDNFITEELCSLSILHGKFNLRYIPHEFLTKELCEIAVKKDGFQLEHVPEHFKDKKMCNLAIESGFFSLKYIPKKYRTKEICLASVINNENNLQHVPQKFVNEDFLAEALGKNQYLHKILSHDLYTRSFLEKITDLISNFSFMAEDINEIFENHPDIVEKIITKNTNNLLYLKKALVTKKISEIAVNNNPDLIRQIPLEYVTSEMCKKAVKHNAENIHMIQRDFIDEDLCKIAVSQKGECFRLLPSKFKTQELCDLASQNFIFSRFFSPSGTTKKDLVEIALTHAKNHNLNLDFEEILVKMFENKNNKIKEIFTHKSFPIKSIYKHLYIEHIIDKIIENKHDSKNLFSKLG